ncbi:hypothetical protein PVK06_043546 [Gossypium arboreum]|uniref:Retrotransposon Copia-like N-terminal domain-containing protein n=1 Tax=Gossypium arboreum TaxID=29729 RepID=A0ABR0MNU9_GOSAR|nr:hypothetical protein PVK06_043546 [Gossypium arboreum]
MANSIDSTSTSHTSLSFSISRLVQSFPHHDTMKLDKGNFVQWQQHVQLITEGYELQGILEGTLPTPPRFMASPDGVLTPNPNASLFVQQDMLLASWLLSTISSSVLSCFTLLKRIVKSVALQIIFLPLPLVLRCDVLNMNCTPSRKES